MTVISEALAMGMAHLEDHHGPPPATPVGAIPYKALLSHCFSKSDSSFLRVLICSAGGKCCGFRGTLVPDLESEYISNAYIKE